MSFAIRVENLGKSYQLGATHAGSVRELVNTAWNRLRGRSELPSTNGAAPADAGDRVQGNTFWALKDVSFEVKPGEVVGIIGRNGSGKSTLLKILSQITAPTTGRIELRGRVASLLEVGTGFHPELSGRENIYLNGAILGMTKSEITRKFDEIVAFAEIEKFIDTPVKRYSSGMYVRLAFAVAAHLEPEILVVDEVLAVGDAAFQKKCIGKMKDSANSGKTVFFVSHNMPAVVQLCKNAVHLENGRVNDIGAASNIVDKYLHTRRSNQPTMCDFSERPRPEWVNRRVELTTCRIIDPLAHDPWCIPFGSRLCLEIGVRVNREIEFIELGIGLFESSGFEVASILHNDTSNPNPLTPGEYTLTVRLPDLMMVPGRFFLGIGLRSERGDEDYIAEAISFDINANDESAAKKTHLCMGVVLPQVRCSLSRILFV